MYNDMQEHELAQRQLTRVMADFQQLRSLLDMSRQEIERAHLETLQMLARTLALRIPGYALHQRRIALIATSIARTLGLDARLCHTIGRAAPLHDIGLLTLPEQCLNAAAQHDEAGTTLYRSHTTRGSDLIPSIDLPIFRTAVEIIRHHHEHWDGSGFPDGLRRHNIPLAARIVAVADNFDRIRHATSERQHHQALSYIFHGAGKRFDPEVADALLAAEGRIAAVCDYLGWQSEAGLNAPEAELMAILM